MAKDEPRQRIHIEKKGKDPGPFCLKDHSMKEFVVVESEGYAVWLCERLGCIHTEQRRD